MPFGTLRPSGRIRGLKALRTTACHIVMILALTGCGLLPFGNKDNTQTPVDPPPQSTLTPETLTDSTLPPESILPSDDAVSPDGVLLPVDPAAPEGYVQVPAQAPAPAPELPPPDLVAAAGPLQLGPEGAMGSLGLNLESYFGEAADTEERLTRVERALTAIHRDLRILAPPILRLITVEQDIQALVTQLTQLAQASPRTAAPAGAVPLTPTQAGTGSPGAAPPRTPAAQQGSGGPPRAAPTGPVTVERLRLGEHADKTRIVLDVSGPATYRYDIDNGENILVIEIPEAGWSGKLQEQVAKSPVLASWNVFPMEAGGSRVILQLKKDTSVVYESVIKPNGYDDYRIVIDLKK